MKFERRNAYGTPRYYPRDEEAQLLVSIFKHPPARTLSHMQICVLSQFGIAFELVADKNAVGRFKNLKIDGI